METTATMSFYEYVQKSKTKSDGRKHLAEYLERLSEDYPKVEEIDSFSDVVDVAVGYFNNIRLEREFSEALWVEYCTACDHPL